MPGAVTTTVTELPESRVRIEAQVAPKEVQGALDRAAKQLGGSLRIPGFRKGKVPPPVVIRRLGRAAVLDEAVRTALPVWYADAVTEARARTVGEPQLELGDLPGEGEPLTFAVEIGVRPKAKLGANYLGVEVGRREPAAGDDDVERELDALRERAARLEPVEREAREGDTLVIDYSGTLAGEEEPFEGGTGADQTIELGSGRLIPGFEDGLVGAKAGEERELSLTFPDEYGAEHLAGKDAVFAVTVKDVRERVLPDADDDFALESAGFDTLDELREDLRAKLREGDEQRIEQEFREAVLDAVVKDAEVDVPEALVDARARELWDRMTHSLAHQGISKEMYLQISGKGEDELLEEAKPDAEQALRREAVVAAVVEAQDVKPSDGDVLDALQASAVRENTTPEKLRKRLEKQGRLEDLEEDLAARVAVDLLVEKATAISVEEAQAKDLLWTPEKGEERAGAGPLWTPGA